MKLAELRAEIEAHPQTIKVEDLPDEDFGFYLFWRITFKKNEDEADQMAVCIIIDKRGEVEEQAWYKGKPSYMRDELTPFKDAVEAGLAAYITNHPEIEYYKIDFVDEADKVAKIAVYEYDAAISAVREKLFIVFDRDGLKVRRVEA